MSEAEAKAQASAKPREFDLIVYGATGFTGGLVAEYLLRKGELPINRWAIAGRDKVKLTEVRARLKEIDPSAGDLSLVSASSGDTESLEAMCARTRVVITTVGPYKKYGEPLVAAAVRESTDYVDLTGEPSWWKQMIERYHDRAAAKGVRIVPCCGFDSIPHDLGALFTAKAFQESRRAGQAMHIEGYVSAKGSFSGGTWASALGIFGEMGRKSGGGKSGGAGGGSRRSPARGIHRSPVLDDKWVAPMPSIDPLVVKRSAKLGKAFGPDFRYDHYITFKDTKMMVGTIAGVGAIVAASQLSPLRRALTKLRPSGAGPDEAQRAKSWFRVRFVGRSGDQRVITEVSGGDPGYGETSKMMAETGLCLALDDLEQDASLNAGGVLTPASACGQALIDRLMAQGIDFRVIERG